MPRPIWKSNKLLLQSLLSTAKNFWANPWTGVLSLSAMVLCVLFFFWHLPPSSYAITVMAVAAGVMTLRQDMSGWERSCWFVLLLWLMVIEFKAIRHDRQSDELRFQAVVSGFQSQLSKSEEILRQTTGSDSFPEFFAVYPSHGGQWFVEVVNNDSLPLFDVSVDVVKRPPKGSTEIDTESIRHPVHYEIGTLAAKNFRESQIRLAPGRYLLWITTRRSFFQENINIDRDPSVPTGWRTSWCLYKDSKEIAGKCD
jgi:hypothetical protein